MANLFDLAGKVAIITGSSRGIGRAIALQMAAHGAKVVVSSRKAEACAKVVAEIEAAGGEAMALPASISDKAALQAMVDATTQAWGGVDILVCNAAINPVYGPLDQLSDEAFDKIMGANVKSNLWLCNLVIPGMAERGGGAIVIVSSIAGIRGTPVIGGYGISKAADFALARNLAVEWGHRNIRVNCVAPGLVQTDFAKALWEDPETLDRRNATTPLRRIGQPDEIGGVVAFLAGPAASFITGQVIVADGGVTIG